MALSDLKVYSEFAYSSMTEVLRQQVDLFNGQSGGMILLSAGSHLGDFSDETSWAKVDGLVRRRNAYGTGAVTAKHLAMITDTMVKVAAGTPPIEINPGQFKWIMKNPEEAGIVLGQQLAVENMADMLNTGLGVFVASHSQVANQLVDITGATAPADTMSFDVQNTAAFRFGDGAGGQVQGWVMHSKVLGDLYGKNLTNANALFNFGTVNIKRDPFGRLLIMTDSPSLILAGSPNVYYSLGMLPGAISVVQNNDYTANEETKNGDENIQRTFQAEWSFELGIKGFAWDKTNGGKSPTDASLMTATNWDKYVTSNKDLGGVVIKSH